jgi:EAL domain-containing protein (putative c-di-GMP-specific phosphodiesterase class I)
VETADQLDHLTRLRCDLAQGYLLHRPASAQALLTTLSDGTAR